VRDKASLRWERQEFHQLTPIAD